MTTRYLIYFAVTTIFLLTAGWFRRAVLPHFNNSPHTTSVLTSPNFGGHAPAFSPEIQGHTLSLSDEQYTFYFPGLVAEVDLAVARGPIAKPHRSVVKKGHINGRIWDGKVYVTGAADKV